MTEHYDVVVAGGGSGGVAAAVGAARAGARTLLIERGPCLGGAATLRNVVTYCGLYTRAEPYDQVVYGVAEQVLAGLRAEDAVTAPQKFTAVAVPFDPETAKRVLDRVCVAAGVEIRLHSMVLGARRDAAGRVTAVRVGDHSGLHEITASAFVDASGEADLAWHAGAEVRYGNEGKVQNGTLAVRFGGIPADVPVTRDLVREAVQAARGRGVAPLTAERGLVARLPVSGDVITFLADEGYDARDAADTSRAEISARAQSRAYLEAIRSLPGCAGAYIVATGPELGTRESRHVAARYRMSESDVLDAGRFDDAIALGAWPVEYHPGPGEPSEWRFIKDDGYYEIPYGTVCSADTPNLFAAGRTVDGDRVAGGSLRVMGTAFATGHAAGIAAALTAGHGATDATAVRAELLRQDAYLPGAS
ncbi:FAD-dependent oxidoreductase [Spirillospora sp. NPDC029432]|uniref:FAD-dependent oxidoreductase n=1 Tax=Spirillospora sp. NPDC029432 TaxID=3154599 RepID=UPI0034526F0F